METAVPEPSASAPPATATRPSPSGKKKPVIWIALALVALVVAGWFYWTRSTYHLETVEQGKLYRAGLQDFREFENALRQVKPKTIVSLIDDRETADPEKPQFKREVETFTDSTPTKLVRVPVKLGGWPEEDEIERFLAVAQDPANQPVMVHCAQGVRRTGMMVAAYQISVLGWDKEKAKAELLTFGHSDRTVNDIKKFIDSYDPATKRMTTKYKQSNE